MFRVKSDVASAHERPETRARRMRSSLGWPDTGHRTPCVVEPKIIRTTSATRSVIRVPTRTPAAVISFYGEWLDTVADSDTGT